MNENEINAAYTNLALARTEHAAAVENLANHKAHLEAKTSRAVAAGEVIGKNAEERAANLRVMFEIDNKIVQQYEESERAHRLEYDLSLLEVERLRLVVRYLSIGATSF